MSTERGDVDGARARMCRARFAGLGAVHRRHKRSPAWAEQRGCSRRALLPAAKQRLNTVALGARTQAAGQLRANLQLVQRLVVLQRLRIGVDRPELHALQRAGVGV